MGLPSAPRPSSPRRRGPWGTASGLPPPQPRYPSDSTSTSHAAREVHGAPALRGLRLHRTPESRRRATVRPGRKGGSRRGGEQEGAANRRAPEDCLAHTRRDPPRDAGAAGGVRAVTGAPAPRSRAAGPAERRGVELASHVWADAPTGLAQGGFQRVGAPANEKFPAHMCQTRPRRGSEDLGAG